MIIMIIIADPAVHAPMVLLDPVVVLVDPVMDLMALYMDQDADVDVYSRDSLDFSNII